MKTHVLIVSETFPSPHARQGDETNFFDFIGRGFKMHTMRGNYPLWKKRIEEVQAGEAILSVRKWSGKPYKSKQVEMYRFDASSGVGIQELKFEYFILTNPYVVSEKGFPRFIDVLKLAHRDGLTYADFKEWFKRYNLDQPIALIHFTSFRY